MSAHTELLHNKVALVTGASSGIGEAIAKLLVILGVHVIGLARRGERLHRIAESLEGAEGTFYPYPGDVCILFFCPTSWRAATLLSAAARKLPLSGRRAENILDAFAFADKHYDGIDILVNDAGVFYAERIIDSSTAHLRNTLDTNVLGAAITCREAVKSMRKKCGSGHIVNIVSAAGLQVTIPGFYTASKFAEHALTEDIRQEMTQTKTNIKVTGIYPRIVAYTELYEKGGVSQALINAVPHLKPADIADAVVYALTRPGNIQINRLDLGPLHARPFSQATVKN